MSTQTIQLALLLGGTLVTWNIVKSFLLPDPLAVVDGPPPDSWLSGEHTVAFILSPLTSSFQGA